jgi:hypothetical protein
MSAPTTADTTAGTGSAVSRTRFSLTERAIIFEQFVAEEVYAKSGLSLDDALSRVCTRICYPQDDFERSATASFRITLRTVERLTVGYLRSIRDDVRRIVSSAEYRLATWDDIAAKGAHDEEELVPLAENEERNGADPCEILLDGGLTRINVISSIGLTQDRDRFYNAVMKYDCLNRWKLANSTEPAGVAEARVTQRKRTKRDSCARNQIAYAKRLKIGKATAEKTANAAEDRARFSNEIKVKALACQLHNKSILASLAQLYAQSTNLPVPAEISAAASASAAPSLVAPKGIDFVDVEEIEEGEGTNDVGNDEDHESNEGEGDSGRLADGDDDVVQE